MSATLAHHADDFAKALTLIPAGLAAVTLTFHPVLGRFVAYLHPVAGYCESGWGNSLTEAVAEALVAINTKHSFTVAYDKAVDAAIARTA